VKALLPLLVSALGLSPMALSGVACNLDLGDDGGSDAESDVTQKQTLNDQCSTIFNELCTQAMNRCGIGGFTVDQCIANDLPSCCIGSACDQTSQFSASDVSACTSAIDGEDCNAIATNSPPSACADFIADQ
jgi:hypothetical protein